MSDQATNQGANILSFQELFTLDENAALYIVLNDRDYHIKAGALRTLLLENLPPQPLPEGVATQEQVTTAIADLITSQELANKIMELAVPDLSNYALAEDLGALGQATEERFQQQLASGVQLGERLSGVETQLGFMVTVEMLSEAFRNFQPDLPQDLVRTGDLQAVQQTLTEADGQLHERVSALENAELVSSSQLAEAIAGVQHPEHTEQFQALDQRVSALEQKPEPDLSGFATTDQLLAVQQAIPTDVVTPAALSAAIEAIPPADLSGLVNETQLQQAILGVQHPEHSEQFQAIEGRLITLEQKPEPDLSGFATTQQLQEAINGVQHPEHTEQFQNLDQRIVALEQAPEPDLSGFATTSQLEAVQQAIPTDTVTQQQLNEAVAAVPQPDLSGFATTASLQTVADAIPTDVVTAQQLQQAIDGVQHPEHIEQFQALDQRVSALEQAPEPDLSGFATTEQLQAVQQTIPTDVVTGQQLQEVRDAIPTDVVTAQQMADAVGSIPHPDLSGFATNSALQEVAESIPQDTVSAQQLSEAIAGVQHPEHTEQFQALDQRVAALEQAPGPDLSDLVTSNDLRDAIAEIPQPDLSGLVTQEALSAAIEAIPPTDLSGLATTQELQALQQTIPTDVVTAQELASVAATIPTEEQMAEKLTKPAAEDLGSVLAYENGTLVHKTLQTGRLFFVNGQYTGELQNGSLLHPYKTIQGALDAAPASSTIMVMPGAYNENLTNVRDNILVQGFGCTDAQQVNVIGTVTVGNPARPTNTRFRMKDIQLKNANVDSPVLVFGDTAGRHYFHNVTVEPIAGTTVPPVQFTGAISNGVDFMFCNFGGEVLLAGAPNNCSVTWRHAGHAGLVVNMVENYNVIYHGGTRAGFINHANGSLSVSNSIGFVGQNGKAVVSSSNVGTLAIQHSSLMTPALEKLKIEKTGTCPALIAYTVRDTTNEAFGVEVTLI